MARSVRLITEILAVLAMGIIVANGVAVVAAAELQLSGSTTVQARILEPLADDIKRATGIDIRVEGVGSGNGLKRLVADEVPVAIVSSPLKSLLAKANIPDD